MDLVTQGVVGAAMASAVAPAQESRRAALIGLGAGLLPDADALIRSADDPLLLLEYHRHFTHALVMIPIVALVAAGVFWLVLRRLSGEWRLSFGRTYTYALLGTSLAGLLDACTSYGTHLGWPFTGEPVAWSIISILDPVFTLLLLVPLTIGLMRRERQAARWGLVLAAGYLLVGLVQHQRAEAVVQELVRMRGHNAERLIVKPTIANLVLWRVLTVTDERVYADAVRVGLGSSRTYPGTSAPLYDPDSVETSPAIEHDLQRFMRFADGVVVRHPEHPHVIGDARFSMLPTSLTPLWGLAVDSSIDPPIRRVTDRSLSPQERRRFIAMLLGQTLSSSDDMK